MVEFSIVEDMRLQKDGRRDVERVADIRKVRKERRIGEALLFFVRRLSDDMPVFHDFCPNAKHIRIIRNFLEKSKYI